MVGGRKRKPRKERQQLTLNDDVEKRILDFVKAGVFLKHAAPAAGIVYTTADGWVARGYKCLQGDPDEQSKTAQRCAEFAKNYEKALAVHASSLIVMHTRECKKGNVQAIQWQLERRYPNEFGPIRRVELSGPGGDPVGVQLREAIERKRAKANSEG